jgi:hypothetical protein
MLVSFALMALLLGMKVDPLSEPAERKIVSARTILRTPYQVMRKANEIFQRGDSCGDWLMRHWPKFVLSTQKTRRRFLHRGIIVSDFT